MRENAYTHYLHNNWLIRLARWPGGGLLDDDYFRRIRDGLKNGDEYSTKEDDGSQIPKKTIGPQTGLGSNDRAPNAGAGVGLGRDDNESRDKSLSSGYNDGGPANDETGPGNTSTETSPYYTVDTNEVFLDLKMKDPNSSRTPSSFIKRIMDGPAVPRPHKRYKV